MARSENQKQKLFRILEIFLRETDDEHGITVPELILKLESLGISAERKSIYSDFVVLEELGFPILRLFGNPPKYTLGERIFELAELKMLVDAIQSSKFITAGKSRELIEKLKLFAGKGGAGELSRQVFVEDRAKTENSAVLYTVDMIHRAINSNRIISFTYFDFGVDKKKIFRHGAKRYSVSPKSLVWSNENYYLVAYDEEVGILKNFRIDKMLHVLVEDESRSLAALAARLNPADYSEKIFGMYGGREELVTIEARERLAGVVFDRFGMGITLIKTDFGFKASLRVMVSPNFFGWVMSFGADMRILAPDTVKLELLNILKGIFDNYS